MDKYQMNLYRLCVCITNPCSDNFANLDDKYGDEFQMHLETMKCKLVTDTEYPYWEYCFSPENMAGFYRLVAIELQKEATRLEKTAKKRSSNTSPIDKSKRLG